MQQPSPGADAAAGDARHLDAGQADAPGSDGGLHAHAPADASGGVDGGPDGSVRHAADASRADAASEGEADGAAIDGGCPPGARFVTGVVDHEFGPGQNFGQSQFPDPILGPPKGGGLTQGGLDVVSLGNGGFVTVEFEGNAIVDGPGPDFIVFENALAPGGDAMNPFAELGTVAVSDDGETWHEFSCTGNSWPYDSCAGVTPVYANADDNDIDPLDPEVAGGDAFDLAEVGVERARFVRITDRPDLTGTAGVFDLDAVGIVNAECP